jgi:hypothetical protein
MRQDKLVSCSSDRAVKIWQAGDEGECTAAAGNSHQHVQGGRVSSQQQRIGGHHVSATAVAISRQRVTIQKWQAGDAVERTAAAAAAASAHQQVQECDEQCEGTIRKAVKRLAVKRGGWAVPWVCETAGSTAAGRLLLPQQSSRATLAAAQ